MSAKETHHHVNEPSLEEIFSDPMIKLMMARDGTERSAIEQALFRLASMNRRSSTLQ